MIALGLFSSCIQYKTHLIWQIDKNVHFMQNQTRIYLLVCYIFKHHFNTKLKGSSCYTFWHLQSQITEYDMLHRQWATCLSVYLYRRSQRTDGHDNFRALFVNRHRPSGEAFGKPIKEFNEAPVRRSKARCGPKGLDKRAKSTFPNCLKMYSREERAYMAQAFPWDGAAGSHKDGRRNGGYVEDRNWTVNDVHRTFGYLTFANSWTDETTP